jgi:hypothetical protein
MPCPLYLQRMVFITQKQQELIYLKCALSSNRRNRRNMHLRLRASRFIGLMVITVVRARG